MDGFSGFKTATTEELPDATPVLDPFHVVRLAGDALDQCRRRIQQALHGHRGRATDPLYRARRTLHTGLDLLTPRQKARLEALFAGDEHVEVEATWAIYQKMIAAYREPDRANVACHEHGTGVAGFLPGSWDHLDCQSWDHPACRAGGFWVGSLDRRVGVAVMEVYGRGIQGGQCG